MKEGSDQLGALIQNNERILFDEKPIFYDTQKITSDQRWNDLKDIAFRKKGGGIQSIRRVMD